jgi:hypothetical protein
MATGFDTRSPSESALGEVHLLGLNFLCPTSKVLAILGIIFFRLPSAKELGSAVSTFPSAESSRLEL